MQVHYIAMQFPAAYETFAATDVRTLRRHGVDVSVHSLRPADPDAAALLAARGLADLPVSHNSLAASLAGILAAIRRPATLFDLVAWVVRHTWRRPAYLIRSLVLVPRSLGIAEAIGRARPDVVHLFWGHYPAMVGYLVRKHFPETALSMFMGAYDLTWRYGGSGPVARAADVVWTHTRLNVPEIARLGVPQERIGVAYRGVDLERFGGPAGPKVRRRLVSASRLVPAKAVGDVLRVFARVLEEAPDASLVVLGDGPEQGRLEALARALGIAHAVDLRGHVAQETVREELAAAEVFLLMSRSESERLPNVVKEAMASGCLCVVSATAGIDELIRDGVHGFVVPQGDVEAAARRVLEAFRAPERTGALLAEAARHIRDHFDVDRTMGLYLERWRGLVAAGRPPAAG